MVVHSSFHFDFFEFVIWIGLRIQLQRCFVPNNKNSCWYLLLFGTKHLWPPPVSSQIIIHSSSSKGVSSQTIINSCWYLLLFGTKHLWPPPVSSQIIIHSSSSKGVSSQTIINSCWYLLLFGTKHLWRRRNSLLFGTKHLWLRKRTHRAKKPSSTNDFCYTAASRRDSSRHEEIPLLTRHMSTRSTSSYPIHRWHYQGDRAVDSAEGDEQLARFPTRCSHDRYGDGTVLQKLSGGLLRMRFDGDEKEKQVQEGA